MNSPPTDPLIGPPHPINPVIPPYGHPIVQVRDPPDELSDEPSPPIVIISEVFASRTIANWHNVRSSMGIGLGTPHPIRPYPTRGIRLYTVLTRDQWNTNRLQFNSVRGGELRDLLSEIYLCYIIKNLSSYKESAPSTLSREANACGSQWFRYSSPHLRHSCIWRVEERAPPPPSGVTVQTHNVHILMSKIMR